MIKKLIVIILFIFSPIVYAGGNSFDIKITDIVTLSDDKHIIYFQKLEKIDNNKNSYPLDNCQNIKIVVNYKYKESLFGSIEQFFQLLFQDTTKFDNGVKTLKENIKLLKNYQHKTFRIDDIEAFNENPKNQCELYTKTIDLSKQEILESDEKTYFRFILRQQDF